MNYDLQKASPEAEVCFVEQEDLDLKDKDYVFLAEPVSGIKYLCKKNWKKRVQRIFALVV